jgi:hypothetical protein
MPRKKKVTKKEEPEIEGQKIYETIGPFSIMRKPITSDGEDFKLDVTTEVGENSNFPCTRELYKEIMSDKLYSNYRFYFKLHKNRESELVERISTSPKDIYQSYTVEYEDDMIVPDKELYKSPEE